MQMETERGEDVFVKVASAALAKRVLSKLGSHQSSLFQKEMCSQCFQQGMEKVFYFRLLPFAYDLIEDCMERNAIVVVVSPLLPL